MIASFSPLVDFLFEPEIMENARREQRIIPNKDSRRQNTTSKCQQAQLLGNKKFILSYSLLRFFVRVAIRDRDFFIGSWLILPQKENVFE